ncbi:hypothetical protein NKH18_02525 [Streptomyces sp. M10(2022)]
MGLVDVDGGARRPWITWFTDCATNAITGVAVTLGASLAGIGAGRAASAVLHEAPTALRRPARKYVSTAARTSCPEQ